MVAVPGRLVDPDRGAGPGPANQSAEVFQSLLAGRIEQSGKPMGVRSGRYPGVGVGVGQEVAVVSALPAANWSSSAESFPCTSITVRALSNSPESRMTWA